jgi:hypothetical protein
MMPMVAPMQDSLAHQQSSVDPDRQDVLPVVLSFLDDARGIIEGGKGRRWEVFKWAFTLNILLVSATVARDKLPVSPYALFIATAVTTFLAAALILHYDHRITSARKRAEKLYDWLTSNILDVYAAMGEPPRRLRAEQKDHAEKVFFFFGLGGMLLAQAIAISVK